MNIVSFFMLIELALNLRPGIQLAVVMKTKTNKYTYDWLV